MNKHYKNNNITSQKALYSDKKNVIVHQETSYTSPFPVPEHLTEYQHIYPEAPRIIFEAYEKQVKHRILSEEKLIKIENKKVYFAFFTASLLFGFLFYSVYTQYDLGTFILAAIILVAFIMRYINNKNGNKDE